MSTKDEVSASMRRAIELAGSKSTEPTQTQKVDKSVFVPGRGNHLVKQSPYSKRLTLDLTPEDERGLSVWSAQQGTKKNRVLRALVAALLEDEQLQAEIVRRLEAR